VYFVVCTPAKKNQLRFRHVGSDHSLVSEIMNVKVIKKEGEKGWSVWSCNSVEQSPGPGTEK
jgi:hypothetical protein